MSPSEPIGSPETPLHWGTGEIPQGVRDFINHVDKVKSLGVNGRGEKKPYVALSELKDYWETKNIRGVLSPYHDHTRPDTIRDHYLRVFSTLVYSGLVGFLSTFIRYHLRDSSLPSQDSPSQWRGPSPYSDVFERFRSNQWMFFPFEFHPGNLEGADLAPDHILPFRLKRQLADRDLANIYQITIDDDYIKLGTTSKTLILKTYKYESARDQFNNERLALSRLQPRLSDHIVAYYGSFEQHGTMNLVIEHVDGYNLLEYLEETNPPQSPQDRHDFWKSLCGALEGFHKIHQITDTNDSSSSGVIHQDVKPDNIFLRSERASNSFKFIAKIGDFGHSTSRVDARQRLDHRGNATYSAPECSHHKRSLTTGEDVITPQADIFGLGGIFSEVAAWVCGGLEMLEIYRDMRRDELRLNPQFHGSNFGKCFHNGADVLDSVENIHWIIQQECNDGMTQEILKVVGKHMLVANPSQRLPVKQLLAKIEHILAEHDGVADGVKFDLSVSPPPGSIAAPDGVPIDTNGSEPPTPSSSVPPGIATPTLTDSANLASAKAASPSTATPPPVQPYHPGSEIRRMRSTSKLISDIKDRLWRNPRGARRPWPLSSPMSSEDGFLSLPDVQKYRESMQAGSPPEPRIEYLVQKLTKNLSGRDYFFFIDDSPSMLEHAEEVVTAFTALSYVAKQIDTNGIELAFASGPSVFSHSSSTKKLTRTIRTHEYLQESGTMEMKLGELVDKLIRRLPYIILGYQWTPPGVPDKPLSIFVFTDGCWGAGLQEAAGVQSPILRLMEKIKKRGLDRTQVMIQFVRFGDNEDGMRYLQHLDDFGQEHDCDIVDTRSIGDNVYSMFIGSLSHAVDQDNHQHVPASSE